MSFLYLNLTGSVSCDSLGLAPIIPFNSSSLFFACAFLGGRRLKNVLDLKLLESPPIHLKLLPHFAPLSGVCSGLVPYFVRKYLILGFKSLLQRITLVTNNACTNCGSRQSGHTVPFRTQSHNNSQDNSRISSLAAWFHFALPGGPPTGDSEEKLHSQIGYAPKVC